MDEYLQKCKSDYSDVVDIKDSSVRSALVGGFTRLYFQTEKEFDITLVASGGKLHGHKVILVSVSTYFKSLLTSDLTPIDISEVDLGIFDFESLKIVINFIYSGEISFNKSNILQLVEIQDYLGISILHHHLTYYMLTTLEQANCWVYHEMSDRHGLKEVFVKADLFIRKNFLKLICGMKTEFLSVSFDQLISFFKSDFLDVSDHELLLKSLCEWVAFLPEERFVHLEKLLSNVDIARIPSWQHMSENLAAYFSPNHQSKIIEWCERMNELRPSIDMKEPLKNTVIEVLLLIGGMTTDGEIVSVTDSFIPPISYLRVLPQSLYHKNVIVIPPMCHRRLRATAVASDTSVYVLGGTVIGEDGAPCEVYRIDENQWHSLPNLPITIAPKRIRAAYVEGVLYASDGYHSWFLSRNETHWTCMPPTNCDTVFDLVGVNGALYVLGRTVKSPPLGCDIKRYDTMNECWIIVSSFSFSTCAFPIRGFSLDNKLNVITPDEWTCFDLCKTEWDNPRLIQSRILSNRSNNISMCAYKEKQVVIIADESCIQILSKTTNSNYTTPVRPGAALVSINVPILKVPPPPMWSDGIDPLSSPLTVIVLPEGTVIQDGTVLEDGTVMAEENMLEERVLQVETEDNEGDRLDSNEQQIEEVIIDGREEEIILKEEVSDYSKMICTQFSSESAENIDIKNHSDKCEEIRYFCLVCKEEFNSESSLRLHRKQHSKYGRVCKKSGKLFKVRENLSTHQKEKCIKEPDVPCLICDEKFHFKAHLNSHLIEKHSKAKVLEAEQSSDSTVEERYRCSLCPRAFARVGSLNYHVSRKHSGPGKQKDPTEFPHLCTNCGNRYKSGTQLCRHRRWECGKEPMFKCQLCVKKFHHRHGLKQHHQLHLSKRLAAVDTTHYCCEKCGRGYKLKSSLNNHIKWECGKEPVFACTSCHVKFSHKGNLKKHIITKHVQLNVK